MSTASTPRAFSRCKTDAAFNNMNRNRGTMNLIMDTEQNKNFYNQQPKARTTEAGQEYANRNCGSLKLEIDTNSCSVNEPRIVSSRVRPEAQEYALKNTKGSIDTVFSNNKTPIICDTPRRRQPCDRPQDSMNFVLDHVSNKNFRNQQPAQRVKPEANVNASKNGGSMHLCLDDSKAIPREVVQQRVKYEASEYAQKGRGVMNQVLSEKGPIIENRIARVKSEALEIAKKNAGTTKQLFEEWGNEANTELGQPKVRGEGSNIAKYGNKGTLHILIEKHGRLDGDAKKIRNVRGSGKRFALQSKGSSMSLMLHGEKKLYKSKKIQ